LDLLKILVDNLWAGLFAGGLAVIFTAPPRYIVPAFLCGFAGRSARDLLMSVGLNQNWSTVVAAAVLVLVAAAIVRRHVVSPVVLVSGLIPLGAAISMFNAIMSLMRVSSAKGEALSEVSDALNANVGKVFTTSLAIALGLAVGMAIVRLVRRQKVWEGV
jgi:uncharacterized membrane protein YjjB (DUF3815 family)